MKTVITLLLLAAVAVSGLFYFVFFASSENNSEPLQEAIPTNQVVVAESTTNEFSGVGTLADLQKREGSLECSFTYTPNEFEDDITGTYFVAAGMVRGDFVTNAPELGGDVLTSVIVDNSAVYVWSNINGQSFGTKTALEESGESEIQMPVDKDENVRYVCKPWKQVDRSIFVPPTSVLFTDTATGVGANMEYGTVYEEGEF
jgi:hypothetical protein